MSYASPLVSIIIATLNVAEDLRHTLDSLKLYTDQNIEVIVQDGYSSDDTCAVAHEYIPTLISGTIVSEKDSGIYDAWNRALPSARGAWILFMGAGDSLISRQAWATVCEKLQELPPSCEYYSVPVQSIFPPNELLEMSHPAQNTLQSLQHGMCLPHQGLFHRRSLFEMQTFSAVYCIAGDYDFVCRTLKKNNLQTGTTACVYMVFGGLSSSMACMMQREKEFWRISRQYFPHTFSWRILARMLRIKLYEGIQAVFGKNMADIFADLPRRITGKPALWTRMMPPAQELGEMPENPSIDLLVATMKRKKELVRLLASLEKQTYKNFRVLIADQNLQGYLDDSLADFSYIPLCRIQLPPSGVSEARNALFGLCSGDIIAFPDDDCWYDSDMLAQIVTQFKAAKDLGGIVASHSEKRGGKNDSRYPQQISSLEQCFFQSETYLQFYRKELVKQVGIFDPQLGPGTALPYGCGEDTDFLARAWKTRHIIKRMPQLCVHHPLADMRETASPKVQTYAAGRMFLLKKHKMPLFFVFSNILFPLLMLPVDTVRYGKQGFLYRWKMFTARLFFYEK